MKNKPFIEPGEIKLNVDYFKAKKKKKSPPEIIDYDGDSLALVKKAHKGAILTGAEILRITQGETITSDNPVPAYKWDGSAVFTSRKIKRTAK